MGKARKLKLFLLVPAGALAALVLVSSAGAKPTPEITEFSLLPDSTQAGGHPNVVLSLQYTQQTAESGCLADECLDPRTITTHFPTGFIGNPHAAPRCNLADFNVASCPVDSQMGLLYIPIPFLNTSVVTPLMNMATRPDQAGLVAGFAPLALFPIFLELSGRTDSDYGLDSISSAIFRSGIEIPPPSVELWGVPADPLHNFIRFKVGKQAPIYCEVSGIPPAESCPFGEPNPAEPGIPPAPFLQNPTTCATPLSSSVELEYYGGITVDAQAPWPAMTGCQQLSFNPAQITKPTTTSTDSAAGVDFELDAPLPQSAFGASPSSIKRNVVTLPEGFSINPNAADGKVACADSETAIGTLFAAHCPEFAKVGTTEINVAALPGPVFGGLYLGEPKPNEPYRLVLTADGFATHIKLVGKVDADSATGRLTTTFDIPQSNIQELDLHIFGSERGLLATPEQCGDLEVENEFEPWDDELPDRSAASFITISSGPGGKACPNGVRSFSPRFAAGTSNSTAGRHSSFSLTLDRDDGDQNLTGLAVNTPPGFAGTLRGIPYCPEAAIAELSNPAHTGRDELASPACAVASQVGTATTGAGAGDHPLYVGGKVYLAGPYKGGPLSLVVVVPAVSGPYDLGNVAVRAAIQVDPVTAQVTAFSDPIPQILEGIPLRTRYVQVNLNRPGFIYNPTNCEPFAVNASVLSDEGARPNLDSHFQASNCASLGFTPKLGLKLRGSTKRRGHPALRAVLRNDPGAANVSRIVTAMPAQELLDNAHIGTVCTRVQFAADACPPGSRIGRATVFTPVLDQPLSGSVYLRSSSRVLPDIVLALEGQFDIELVGHIDSTKQGGLRTTFATVPDAPFTRAVLDLEGGSRGLLINGESLCKGNKKASVSLIGQNGKRIKQRTKLQTSCSSRRQARKRRHHLRHLYRGKAVG